MPELEKLADQVTDICLAGNKEELELALGRAVKALGFSSFSLACGMSVAEQMTTDPQLSSAGGPAFENYFNLRLHRSDPFLHHGVHGKRPIAFTRDDLLKVADPGFVEFIGLRGLQGGVAVPLSRGDGRLSAFVMSRTDPDAPFYPRLAQAGAIIGRVAQARLEGLGIVTAGPSPAWRKLDDLSGRQREILAWVAQGKTNADIALILALSPRNVTYHVSEILKKLGVTSRSQAAALWAGHPG